MFPFIIYYLEKKENKIKKRREEKMNKTNLITTNITSSNHTSNSTSYIEYVEQNVTSFSVFVTLVGVIAVIALCVTFIKKQNKPQPVVRSLETEHLDQPSDDDISVVRNDNGITTIPAKYKNRYQQVQTN